MNPEEKIKELEHEVSKMKRRFCDMSLCIHPMFLEWRDEKENNIKEATEVLYG